MYLSRVELDTGNRQKIKDLTHAGAYHSWVEDSFPEEKEEGNRSGKLWRIDSLNGKIWLLIVSERKPDFSYLEKYGIKDSAETKDYEPFLEKLVNGMTCQFKVVMNPIHSVSQGKDERGRVYPEITVERQLAFFEGRASQYGFRLIDGQYRITDRRFEILKKHQNRSLRLCKVTYEGKLVIMDADIFRNTLIKGMGRKKAYGFGMMTVIPDTQ